MNQNDLINSKIKEFEERMYLEFSFEGDELMHFKIVLKQLNKFLRQALKDVSDRSVEAVRVENNKVIDDWTPYPVVGHLASDDLKIKSSKQWGFDKAISAQEEKIKKFKGE